MDFEKLYKETIERMRPISYPDSKKIKDELKKKEEALLKLSLECFQEDSKLAIEEVNNLLIENAKASGMSLYRLCFTTIPVYSSPEVKYRTDENGHKYVKEITRNITLSPVDFDLEHDGGYWKGKYFRLKKKMQELIDNKED